MPAFAIARLNHLDSVVPAITERTVAIVLEPIQAEAGVRPGIMIFGNDLGGVPSRSCWRKRIAAS